MIASSSAMTTRVATVRILRCGGSDHSSTSPDRHPRRSTAALVQDIEQFVLSGFEPFDRFHDLGAAAEHGISVTLRRPELTVGEWRLRHERTQTGVVGFVVQLNELLV